MVILPADTTNIYQILRSLARLEILTDEAFQRKLVKY